MGDSKSHSEPELTLAELQNHPLPHARDPELLQDFLDLACRLYACYLAAGHVEQASAFAESAEQASELLTAWEHATRAC